MKFTIEISPGELIDRLTILQIKQERITKQEDLQHCAREYQELLNLYNTLPLSQEQQKLTQLLLDCNRDLWDIEEQKRQHEHDKCFDLNFIRLARQVYLRNDDRARYKQQLNRLLNSDRQEVKSHRSLQENPAVS